MIALSLAADGCRGESDRLVKSAASADGKYRAEVVSRRTASGEYDAVLRVIKVDPTRPGLERVMADVVVLVSLDEDKDVDREVFDLRWREHSAEIEVDKRMHYSIDGLAIVER